MVARLLPAYAAFAVLKHLLPLRALARLAWHEPQGTWSESARERLVACAVRAADVSALPDRDCLQRSLLLYRVLSRAGAEPALSVGFEKTPTGLRGHAWVVVSGRVVGESDTHISRFEPVMRFGRRGAIETDTTTRAFRHV